MIYRPNDRCLVNALYTRMLLINSWGAVVGYCRFSRYGDWGEELGGGLRYTFEDEPNVQGLCAYLCPNCLHGTFGSACKIQDQRRPIINVKSNLKALHD